jgi:hypothetical protein
VGQRRSEPRVVLTDEPERRLPQRRRQPAIARSASTLGHQPRGSLRLVRPAQPPDLALGDTQRVGGFPLRQLPVQHPEYSPYEAPLRAPPRKFR